MAGRGRPSRASVYERLGHALTELDQRFGGLPNPKEAESIWADIWHQEAHHSTALEGNTLVLREVEMLLIQGRAVGAKPLREYNEVKGYADAARWVYGQAMEPGDWYDGRLLTMSEEFTLIALRRAAQRGRLDAVQGSDGIWRSSRRAVDAYRAARHQRRTGNTAPSE